MIEYAGEAMRALSMEGRMTLCNMSIEGGARAGMVAPDETTFAYVKGRRFAPRGRAWEEAVERWRSCCRSDEGAQFDRVVEIDAAAACAVCDVGNESRDGGAGDRTRAGIRVASEPKPIGGPTERALEYMGLKPGTPIEDIAMDRVFIGSCTNSRIEDLRAAARVARAITWREGARHGGAGIAGGQAAGGAGRAATGFSGEAGFEWREAGCSMCLGMNPDILQPGERCASTSNRNFEGRQGRGGRTHLVSPMMAAAAAIAGHFTDIRKWKFQ